MKIKVAFTRAFLHIILAFWLTSCVSRTVVYSSDPTAEITVPQRGLRDVGKLKIESRKPIWDSTEVVVSKPGCLSKTYMITRHDEFAPIGLLLATLTSGFGILWVGGYLSEYQLEFECQAH